MRRLPKENKSLLLQLIILYVKISTKSHITKMTAARIGEIMSATLFRPEPDVADTEKSKLARIISFIIAHYDELFSLTELIDALAAGDTKEYSIQIQPAFGASADGAAGDGAGDGAGEGDAIGADKQAPISAGPSGE